VFQGFCGLTVLALDKYATICISVVDVHLSLSEHVYDKAVGLTYICWITEALGKVSVRGQAAHVSCIIRNLLCCEVGLPESVDSLNPRNC
jgi:hypothetical protein